MICASSGSSIAPYHALLYQRGVIGGGHGFASPEVTWNGGDLVDGLTGMLKVLVMVWGVGDVQEARQDPVFSVVT